MKGNETITMTEVLQETEPKKRAQKYNAYVKQVTPVFSKGRKMLGAFLVGGGICLLGQLLTRGLQLWCGDETEARMYTTLCLVALSVLTTGFGWYAKAARFGGAGTLVPITGFANSVAAAAMEYKPEGQVFGIGSRIFQIAGPVVLYGIVGSFALGIVYWVFW